MIAAPACPRCRVVHAAVSMPPHETVTVVRPDCSRVTVPFAVFETAMNIWALR